MRVGDRWDEVVVDGLTRTQIVQYAGASGDFHPLHHDETVSRAAGYPTIFAHGMLTMGLAGRLLEALAADGRLLRYGARMLAQVWPGDTLTASVEVVRIDADGTAELAVEVRNQRGEVTLAGSARVQHE